MLRRKGIRRSCGGAVRAVRSKKIKVTVHAEGIDRTALAKKVSAYGAELIERRLMGSELTAEEMAEILNRIIGNLRTEECKDEQEEIKCAARGAKEDQ